MPINVMAEDVFLEDSANWYAKKSKRQTFEQFLKISHTLELVATLTYTVTIKTKQIANESRFKNFLVLANIIMCI